MAKLLIVSTKLKKYHIKRVAIIIALTALSVFLLYQIFSFSQELDQYEGLVTRQIFGLISNSRPRLDMATAITISLLISIFFAIPSYVFSLQLSKSRYQISKARLSLVFVFYLLIILIPKASLFLYNLDYTLEPIVLFYISFCCILAGAYIASLVKQPFWKKNLQVLFKYKSYFSIVAACGFIIYLVFILNGIKECGFNLAEVYECRGNLSSAQEQLVQMVLIVTSAFLPLTYLLSKKSNKFWMSILKASAFFLVYLFIFLYTGHKTVIAISILTIYFKYHIDKSTYITSSIIKPGALTLNPPRILIKSLVFSLLAVSTIFILLISLNLAALVEFRWIWALLVNRLILVPAYLDFVYVAENIRGSLTDFGTAAVEAGRLITGVYGTWSNASYFGSSFVRAGLPRLTCESFLLGLILYMFVTQKKTVFLEVLSYIGLLQCFIVLTSLDLQNALFDRGLLLWFVAVYLLGSQKNQPNPVK